jgi:acetyl esterase/lipase
LITPVVDLPGLDALERAVDRSLAPGLMGLVAALERVAPRPEWDFDQIRSGFETAAANLPVPEDVSVTRVDVGGRAGELIEPATPTGRTALYLHGGAYTIGSLSTVRSLAAHFARATRSRAFVLDYRLAPEHPYPAAVDDATAAFGQLATRYPDDLVYLAGDSAGGGRGARAPRAGRGGDVSVDGARAVRGSPGCRGPAGCRLVATAVGGGVPR